MTSDQVIWSEQNRLHVAYETVDTAVIAGAGNAQRMTVTLNLTDASAPSGAVREGQSILISDKATGLVTAKGLVQSVTGATNNVLTVTLYETTYANMSAVLKGTGVASLFVYGSEYAKGSLGMNGSIEPQFTQFSNSPIILKDNFEINGSDAAQIGWIEVATEDGTSGYLWYLKSESETRLRFDDYLEMSMVEAVKYSGADQNFDYGNSGTVANVKGSEGLFSAIEARGNVYSGFAGAAAPGSRGSYDFYKTDWKYLNDATTRGLDNEIDGVMIPAGTTTVYDQMMGVNIRRPFLHIRYRASETEDRRYKSWITGSVGGAYTSDLDAMKVNFLSERCLVVQAANNFVLFKGA